MLSPEVTGPTETEVHRHPASVNTSETKPACVQSVATSVEKGQGGGSCQRVGRDHGRKGSWAR